MAEPQTYANHRRLDPSYHFFAFGCYAVALFMALWLLWKSPSASTIWMLLISMGLIVHFFKARLYPLRAQDRIIRLEETQRMKALLPADLQSRIQELRPDQFVGLRFASDGELADRVREALQDQLTGEAIKKRIQTWRPDTFRV